MCDLYIFKDDCTNNKIETVSILKREVISKKNGRAGGWPMLVATKKKHYQTQKRVAMRIIHQHGNDELLQVTIDVQLCTK